MKPTKLQVQIRQRLSAMLQLAWQTVLITDSTAALRYLKDHGIPPLEAATCALEARDDTDAIWTRIAHATAMGPLYGEMEADLTHLIRGLIRPQA